MTTNENPPLPVPSLRRRPFAGFGAVFAWGVTRVVRWRKVLVVAAAALLVGALVGYAASRHARSAYHLALLLDRAVLTFGLPLVTLLLASDGFAFEVSARTLVYHLVRPVSRTTVFFARFFAGVVPAFLVSTLFLASIVAFSGARVGFDVWRSLPATALAASLALGAVYYTLGALFRHGLVAGLIYTFVIETMLSSVPGSMQKLSVMFHVRALHHELTSASLPVVAPPASQNIISQGLLRVTEEPAGEAVLVLAIVTVVLLTIGARRVATRDWALKD